MLIMGLVVLDPRKHIVFTFHPYTVSTAERSPLWIVHLYIYLCDTEVPVDLLMRNFWLIKNTRSDRTRTEKEFNSLPENYRSTILPSVIVSLEHLTQEGKEVCSNFVCG